MQFRLIHFWEARKNVKGGPGILLGIEMLMIDAEVCLPRSLLKSLITSELDEQTIIFAFLGLLGCDVIILPDFEKNKT